MTRDDLVRIGKLRSDMELALAQARVYQDALTNYYDVQYTWPSLGRWRSVRRLMRRLRVKHDEAMRISAVIQAEVATHALMSGPERGPIIRG